MAELTGANTVNRLPLFCSICVTFAACTMAPHDTCATACEVIQQMWRTIDRRADTVLQHHSLLTRSDCEVSTAAIDSVEVFDDSKLCVIAASDGEGAMGMLMATASRSVGSTSHAMFCPSLWSLNFAALRMS